MTHRCERYAARVGITSSLKELRHYSATQLLTNGVDLRTVSGRLGHAEGSTTLRFYAQFARPADQRAAGVVSGQLAELRKKERLRDLFREHLPAADASRFSDMALAALAELAGLDKVTALAYLAEFGAERTAAASGRRRFVQSHLRVTSRRCQASSVAGVTASTSPHRRRGISFDNAASQSRPAGW